jgi:hypothetical protein
LKTCPVKKKKDMPDLSWLKKTRPEPPKPAEVPAESQWLSGEGAGSWFHIAAAEEGLWLITRYAPDGKIECRSHFECTPDTVFDISRPYRFDYLSHCREVTIRQDDRVFRFVRVDN